MINVKLHFILPTITTVEHKYICYALRAVHLFTILMLTYVFRIYYKMLSIPQVFYLIPCEPHKSSLYIFTELGILSAHIYVMS